MIYHADLTVGYRKAEGYVRRLRKYHEGRLERLIRTGDTRIGTMAPTDAAPPMLERRSVRNSHAVSLRMPPSPCGSWEATRRELGEYAYGVLSIDAIAVILGGLGSRHLGSGMWLAGLGLAAYVTLCFTLLIVGNLAIECVAGWWLGWLAHRRSRRPRRRYYWLRRRV